MSPQYIAYKGNDLATVRTFLTAPNSGSVEYHDGKGVEIRLSRFYSNSGEVYFQTVRNRGERHKGHATKAMRLLVRACDRAKRNARLNITPMDGAPSALTKEQLYVWYAKFGFRRIDKYQNVMTRPYRRWRYWRLLVPLFGLLAIALVGCLSVPRGVHIVVTDKPELYCEAHVNCYNANARAIVVVPGQAIKIILHEAFHAHQHQTILDAGLPVTLDLRSWYSTDEAKAYAAAIVVEARPSDWVLSADNLLEDFAEAGARCVARNKLHELQYSIEPVREGWMEAHGFC